MSSETAEKEKLVASNVDVIQSSVAGTTSEKAIDENIANTGLSGAI
jgi:hypothetical protein